MSHAATRSWPAQRTIAVAVALMQVREFAERLLMGETLGDKLHDPGTLRDDDRGSAWTRPVAPARPPGLTMRDRAAPFPKDGALANDRDRGRALHFFANHELLALELMALALLRYVDAPAAFRRGLVATIRDEQRHLSLYLARMAELEVDFGEEALGGFFWRTVSDLPTPLAFVAHMSLTFEQANLDHARFYADRFAALGDAETAAVIERVYADEVRHVRTGLHWFSALGAEDQPLLAAHRGALVPPVTLRRARGRGFDAQGRLAAGLPEAYVATLANMPSARGRPPVVHVFDPTVEMQLAQGDGYNPDAAARARARDLECLPLLYADRHDVVLARATPRPEFLASLRRAGLPLAEVITTDLDAPRIDVPSLDKIAAVQPWGWTPSIARRLVGLRGRAIEDPVPVRGWATAIFHKARGVAVLRRVLETETDPQVRARLEDPSTIGRVARDLAEVTAAVEHFVARGATEVALKAQLGTAGRGTLRLDGATIPDPRRRWLSRILAQQGAVVVEPWRDRVCDLSLRMTIDAPGRARIDGVGRFLVDPRGQYLGAVVGRWTTGLSQALLRFVHADGRDPRWLDRVWDRVVAEVVTELRDSGYVGTVGVDAMIVRDAAGRLRLRPVVELNTRVHMGHVAVHLARRVAAGRVGLWRLRRRVDIKREGHADLTAYAAALSATHPLQTSPSGAIEGGALLTNDPAHAREVLGVLAVAPTLPRAAAIAGVDAPDGG